MVRFILLIFVAIELYSNPIDNLNHYIAQIEYKNGFYKKALKNFKKLPASATVNFEIASTLYRLKRYKEAIAYFKLANTPKLNGLVYFNIANCYLKMREYKKAIDMYKSASKFYEIKQKAIKAMKIAKKSREIKLKAKIKECKGLALGRGDNKAKIYKFDDPFVSKDLKLAKLKDESKLNISNSKAIKSNLSIEYNKTKSIEKKDKIYSLKYLEEKRVNNTLINKESKTLLIPIGEKD